MYSISPKISNNYSSNYMLNELIDSINKKILMLAICEYNNIRFGLGVTVNYHRYKDLLTLKKILLDKLLGCNCLDNQFLINIVNKIKELINQ